MVLSRSERKEKYKKKKNHRANYRPKRNVVRPKRTRSKINSYTIRLFVFGIFFFFVSMENIFDRILSRRRDAFFIYVKSEAKLNNNSKKYPSNCTRTVTIERGEHVGRVTMRTLFFLFFILLFGSIFGFRWLSLKIGRAAIIGTAILKLSAHS